MLVASARHTSTTYRAKTARFWSTLWTARQFPAERNLHDKYVYVQVCWLHGGDVRWRDCRCVQGVSRCFSGSTSTGRRLSTVSACHQRAHVKTCVLSRQVNTTRFQTTTLRSTPTPTCSTCTLQVTRLYLWITWSSADAETARHASRISGTSGSCISDHIRSIRRIRFPTSIRSNAVVLCIIM